MNLNKIVISKNVFKPTGTSQIMIEAAKKIINPKKKILDLGCGSGIIGISIAKFFNIKKTIFFSDVSKNACNNTLKNCKKLKIKNLILQGSNLEPWTGYKFDFILSDVAAIAEKISNISPWYIGSINNSGIDGTKHIVKIINSVKNNLNKKGVFIFPIISLSNEKKILNELKKNFKYFKKIKTQEWPMPSTMMKYIKLLNQLKKDKIINFKKKFDILTFKTDIYLAKKS